MLRLLAGALALALTAPVWADLPSFSFAGAAYQRVELDGIGLNIDGNSFGIDVNELQVGAGYIRYDRFELKQSSLLRLCAPPGARRRLRFRFSWP